MEIPKELLPKDGRFGSGPTKVQPEALTYLSEQSQLLGTSHRRSPVRELVGRIQDKLSELFSLPAGYEVVLGNGGASLFWEIAAYSLIAQTGSFGVFGEFTKKFADIVAGAPWLAQPIINESPPGGLALPEGEAEVYAWAQNETSTGVVAPVRRIAGGLNLVDATSAAGGIDVDLTQTDAYYFAPQKNFSAEGGLWIAFLSPAAIDQCKALAKSRWIPPMLSLWKAVEQSRQQQTVNTPAITTLLLLEWQLDWMVSLGGISAIQRRCTTSADQVYAWATTREYASPFVSDEALRSPVVATVDLAEDIDADQVLTILRSNGVLDIDPYRSLGRNQLRISCYASIDPNDVAALLNCLDYLIQRL